MSAAARVSAQAKVNLRLRVLAREASGYHSIETIFLRLDLADDVQVRLTSGRSLDCTGTAMPPGGLGPMEKNLAFRAAERYAAETGWPDGFAIEIDKRIPVGGGLGGGSADSGAVLRALDALSPSPLGPRLVELAAPLGADVSFMAIDSPMALGWGRGERLLPMRPLDPRPVVLLVPDFGVATADAYGWLAAERGTYAPAAEVLLPESLATWEAIVAVATNDFEPVVANHHPRIAQLLSDLEAAGAVLSMLSGSGSTVFGAFAGEPGAAVLKPEPGLTKLVTQTSARVERVEVRE